MNSEQIAAVSGSDHLSSKKELVRAAEELVGEHGDAADLVAARLADSCFSAGDRAAGFRWSKIFVILAVAHIRSARGAQAPV